MKNIKLFLVLILLVNEIYAQNIEWSKCFGGSNEDNAWSIQQTDDGGYVVINVAESYDGDVNGLNGAEDIWILKLNATGDTTWTKCYGGSSIDRAGSIQQTSDGGYIVAGYTNSSDGDVNENFGYYDYWILKLNATGDTIWTKIYGGSDYEYAHSIQQTSDGGYIIAGLSKSNDGYVNGNHGLYDYWILKLNATGDTIWTKCYGGTGADWPYSIQQTNDGGYIVAGYTESNNGDVNGNHGVADYWILKLNAIGDTIWTKCYGGSGIDLAWSIQQTSDSGYIVVGRSQSNNGDVSGNHGLNDYWLLKLNNAGDTIWAKCYGGSDNDYAQSVIQTGGGGYIVAGYTESLDGDVSGSHGGGDYWILKLNAIGDTIWTKCYGGSDYDDAQSIQQTSDGGYIIAGYTKSFNGDVSGNHGDDDSWILKIGENSTTISAHSLSSRIQVYPNPTLGRFRVDSGDFDKIVVLNINGQIIMKTIEETINISSYPAGIYYIRISKGNETITQEIIKK